MRIAFIDSWLQQVAEGSGTAAAIGGLGHALTRAGHHVARIAPPKARPANLTVRRLLFNATLPALMQRLDYDLVVGFDIDGVALAGQRGGPPYLCSIKGVIAEELQHEQGQVRALLWALSRLERLNARRAPRTLTTSDYCRQAITRHYGVPSQKIALVPEGLAYQRWAKLYRPQRNGQTILCVARQYPRKHVADLIAAMPSVRKACPQARAVIVGDGPEHPRLQRMVAELNLSDCVLLTGALPDAAVEAWYSEADLFCLPSVQEGFGIVFLEAMAAGLPIVATRAAAIPEVVPDGRAGQLISPGSVAELGQALSSLLQAPARRREMAAAGHEHARRYDWERVAEQFLSAARAG